MTSAPIAGDTLIAAILISNAGGSLMSVNGIIEAGVLWNPVISSGAYAGSYTTIWVGTVNSGASQTIIIHDYGPVDGAVADVVEYPGTLVLDQTASASGAFNTATTTGTTGTTVTPNELEIGAIGVCESTQSSPTNGFVMSDGLSYTATIPISLAYLQYSSNSIGTASTGTTISDTLYPSWDGVIATFTFSSNPVVTPTPYQPTPSPYQNQTPTPYYPTPSPTPYFYPTPTPFNVQIPGTSFGLTLNEFLALVFAVIVIVLIGIGVAYLQSSNKSKSKKKHK
jgi:uncharacterized protein (UPF0333 family)